ncbi:TasA family protein [Cellulosimicrobium sp. Marseille-Q4280]|uniref:TasA family protein n=1 Tax=Cellulosimicrobium sp. Marseille-Q4280 TaxID=2937992 RepID=UPI00203FD35A|nr:TasA family protein [Cellulosimicrobium sp. Marseille-Q4280]
MSTSTTTAAEQPTRRRRVVGLLAAGAVIACAGAAGTSALFTDQEVVSDNTFAAGTFDLTANQPDPKIELPNMLPGDSADFDVVVGNGGTLELRYSVEGAFSAITEGGQNLGETLDLEVTDADGTVLFDGTAASLTQLVGDKAEGPQAGDRVLGAAQTETLNFKVTYPEDSDNTFAGADASLTLTLDAEQTANNG